MDFSVPEHELVLWFMNFSAPDSGLVLQAWILVLWGMNLWSVGSLGGSLERPLAFAGYSEAPKRFQNVILTYS